MSLVEMLETLRQSAAQEGFVLCGVTPAVESSGYSNLVRWIESGYAGEMDYFANRQDAYRHPDGVLSGASSIIVMAYPYDRRPHRPETPLQGKIARYAWTGIDYHDVIHPKLKRLRRIIEDAYPNETCRGVVDTAPLLEREWGQIAGLGWRAKNTLLINKDIGSYFFLACLITSLRLPYDNEHRTFHCGTCTACLDACPTDAFVEPGVLDATRCISYLTIEHRDHIPAELRPGIGDWVFGCDVCQEVCPWNRKPSRTATEKEQPLETVDLPSLFLLDDDQFRERFRKTPLWRTRRRGILRNAAIVLGNQGDTRSVSALGLGLQDSEPIVRAASAWALGQLNVQESQSLLRQQAGVETDSSVQAEIRSALQQLGDFEAT